MSTDFPHPHYRYYIVELNCDGTPTNLWISRTYTRGTDSRNEAIKRAQELVIDKSHELRHGLAVIEVLDVISPISVVTANIETVDYTKKPEVWDEDEEQ